MTDPKLITDADVVSMGDHAPKPQGGEPEPKKQDAAPKEVEVEIGGTKFKMAPEMGAAVKAMQEASERTARELRTSLEAAKAVPAAVAAPAAKAEDLSVKLFADPEGTLKQIKDEAVREAVAQVTAAYAQQQNQVAFWTEFYNQNKDLSEHDLIVKAVMNRDFQAMTKEGLTAGEAIKRIAASAKEEIVKLGGGRPRGEPKPKKQGAEGAGNLSAATESEQSEGDEKPTSLTDILKARREARRKAAAGPTAKA